MDTNNSKMDQFADKLMEVLSPIIKLMNYPFAQSLQEGFAALIPAIVVGSVMLIIGMGALPGGVIEGKTLLPFLTNYSGKIFLIYSLTIGLAGFIAVVYIAIGYAKRLDLDPANAGVMALLSYLVVSVDNVDAGIPMGSLGSGGLFVSIIVAFVCVRIFKVCMDKDIRIKMPKEVPPAVSNSFSAFIPLGISMLLFWFIRHIIGFDVTSFVANVIQPILNAGDTMISNLVYTVLTVIFGFFGMHGQNILSPVYYPLQLQWTLENTAAFAAHTPLPHIWTTYFFRMGASYFPLWLLCLRSKVPHFRTIGKVSTVCGIFNIWEPLFFGVPVAMNPLMFIPEMLRNIAEVIICRVCTMIGFVPRMFLDLPFCIPSVIGLPIATGSFTSVIVWAITFVVSYIIWLPFFKAYEKQELKRMEAAEAE